MKKDNKIFIAGGTGLVGSAIIRYLLSDGYTNIISSYHNRPPMINEVRNVKIDLQDSRDVNNFFIQEKPEYVFLAAALVGGIMANNLYRADFIYNNLQIQNNVIHNSYLARVKKLLFLGSSCIYPKECPQPMREDSLLTSPLEYTNEPYAIAKIAGIKMCESYNTQYGTNFISVMPTNLYGPHDNFDLEKSHVMPAMIRKFHLAKLLQNDDREGIMHNLQVSSYEDAKTILDEHKLTKDHVTLWGTGEPRREFLYSDDLAEACVYLMANVDFIDLIYGEKEIINTHINIGTGKDISLKELANIIKDIVGYSGDILWDTTKPNGTMVKLLDVSRLNKLGWKEKVDLHSGINMVYDDYVNKSII